MIRAATLVVATTALLAVGAGCGRWSGDRPPPWVEIQPGLSYALADAPAGSGIPLHLVRFSPQRFTAVVTPASSLDRAVAVAEDFRRSVGGVVAVNGGYFDPQLKPLGLLVSQGRELSRLRRVDHGVFYLASGVPGLVHARDWHPPAGLEFAVECGPRLVVDGKPLTFKPGFARRVAIGHDAAGRVLLAVTEAELSLAEFAERLAQSESRGGPGIVSALNLDGGSSTMLAIAAGDLRVSLASAVAVPVGLVVVPRSPVRPVLR